MEFHNLGKHCFEPTCRQIDFLPFTCKFCTNTYCLEHREFKAHNCPKQNTGDIKAIVCPTCLKTLKFDCSIHNENEFFDIHAATDCTGEYYDKARAAKQKFCEAPKCKTKLLPINTYSCDNCGKNLCLSHRYQDTHECKRVYRGSAVVVDDSKLFKKTTNVSTQPALIPVVNQNHVNNEQCEVCSRSFRNIEDLLSHAQEAHYSRSISPITRPNTNSNTNQMSTTCKSEASREVCGLCGKTFTGIDDLLNHAQQSHYVN